MGNQYDINCTINMYHIFFTLKLMDGYEKGWELQNWYSVRMVFHRDVTKMLSTLQTWLVVCHLDPVAAEHQLDLTVTIVHFVGKIFNQKPCWRGI